MKTLLGLLAAVLIIGSVQAQNLLKNGDFSDGLNGWDSSRISGTITPGAILKVEALPDAGGKSGKLAQITDEEDTAGISLLQDVPAEAGKAYTLTFMSRTTVPKEKRGSPGFVIIWFYANGTWLKKPKAPTATGTLTPEERKSIKRDVCILADPGKGWQASTLTATAPAGTTKLRVEFKAGNDRRGTMDVSDVSITQSAP